MVLPEIGLIASLLIAAAPESQTPLGKAVEDLNRKTGKDYFDKEILRQPPLAKERRPKAVTVEEVVSAIKSWDRLKVPVSEPTYRMFQHIANSKTLLPGATFSVYDQWREMDERDKYEHRVWRIDLSVMTDEKAGFTFVIREQQIDRRLKAEPAPKPSTR